MTEYLASLVDQEINMNYALAMFPSKFNINGLTRFVSGKPVTVLRATKEEGRKEILDMNLETCTYQTSILTPRHIPNKHHSFSILF